MKAWQLKEVIDHTIKQIKKELNPAGGMCGCKCNQWEEYYCESHWAEVMKSNPNYRPKGKRCINLK